MARPVRTSPIPLPTTIAAARGLLATALALLVLVGATACTADSPSPRVRHAVQVLADGLETGDLSGVRTSDGTDPTGAYAAITAGMDGVLPRVTSGTISMPEAGRASVPLAFEWRFGSGTWRYETTASFQQRRLRWGLAWQPALVHPALGTGDRLVHRWTPAERGRVLGRGRRPIVLAREVFVLGLDKSTVPPGQVEDSARRIARALQVDEQRYLDRVRAAGDIAFVEALTIRTEQAQVPPAFLDTPGARVHRNERQLAPTPTFAQGLLGSVVPADAERAGASGGSVREGDPVGRGGLEERYDLRLRGVPGDRVVIAPRDVPAGTLADPPVLFQSSAKAGGALETTLDEATQLRAEQVLADVPAPAAMVVLEASTGAVLAAATSPAAGTEPIATYGRYAPGQVFAPAGLLALLRTGSAAEAPVTCTPGVAVGGRTLPGPSLPPGRTGPTTLAGAVAAGCTTVLAEHRGQVGAAGPGGAAGLGGAAASLGVGPDHDAGFPAFYGTVPAPDDDVAAAEALMGRGAVQASPFAMAGMAASIAAGRTVLPYLLEQYRPTSDAAPLAPAEVAALRTTLQQGAREGSAAALSGVATGALAGGTGIAGAARGAGVSSSAGSAGAGSAGAGSAGDAWVVAYRGDEAVAVLVTGQGSDGSAATDLLRSYWS